MDQNNTSSTRRILIMLAAAGAVVAAVVILFASDQASAPNAKAPVKPVETPDEINVMDPVRPGKKKRDATASVEPQTLEASAARVDDLSASLATQHHADAGDTSQATSESAQDSSA